MKKILWISGILAAIALIPGAVILGLFLFILPGLILAVAPTVFLYAVGFEVLRIALPARLRIRTPTAINAVAAGLTLALGFALAAPFALHGRRSLAAATREDVSPSAPVSLQGDVRLDRYGEAWSSTSQAKKVECDALCAALLDTPGVRSVTIGGDDPSGEPVRPVTYRLIAKHQARSATLMPVEPAKIIEHLPEQNRGDAGGKPKWQEALETRKALAHSIAATWALRLGGAESLVAESPPATFGRTISIRNVRAQGIHRIGVTEVAIEDGDGTVLMRRQRVTAAPVAAPVHLT